MIVKFFLFCLFVVRFLLGEFFMYFDLYDVIYVFFLGVLGICLRFVECGLWYVNKKV